MDKFSSDVHKGFNSAKSAEKFMADSDNISQPKYYIVSTNAGDNDGSSDEGNDSLDQGLSNCSMSAITTTAADGLACTSTARPNNTSSTAMTGLVVIRKMLEAIPGTQGTSNNCLKFSERCIKCLGLLLE